MFKFFFNRDNILWIIATSIGYSIGTSLSVSGFSWIGLIIFIILIFIINPLSIKITDYIIGGNDGN